MKYKKIKGSIFIEYIVCTFILSIICTILMFIINFSVKTNDEINFSLLKSEKLYYILETLTNDIMSSNMEEIEVQGDYIIYKDDDVFKKIEYRDKKLKISSDKNKKGNFLSKDTLGEYEDVKFFKNKNLLIIDFKFKNKEKLRKVVSLI